MSETPKTKAALKENADASWADDQTEHEYYYDDAHGYETFVDEDEDENKGIEITREPGGIDEK